MPTTRLMTRAATAAATLAAAATVAAALPAAGSASSLSATLSDNAANHTTRVTVKTVLSSLPLNSNREYGTQFKLPAGLALDYYSAIGGSYDNTCSPSAYYAGAPFSTGYTPAGPNHAFDPSYCPATAKVGTVTLGSMSGSLYIVNLSPIPNFAVYFDTGVATPFGRKFDVSWPLDPTGSFSTGESVWTVYGLPNKATTGLSVTFGNPSNPNALQRAFFYNRPSAPGTCQLTQPVTGSVWTYPLVGKTTNKATLTAGSVKFASC